MYEKKNVYIAINLIREKLLCVIAKLQASYFTETNVVCKWYGRIFQPAIYIFNTRYIHI